MLKIDPLQLYINCEAPILLREMTDGLFERLMNGPVFKLGHYPHDLSGQETPIIINTDCEAKTPPGEMVRARVEACSGSIFKLGPRSHNFLGQETAITINTDSKAHTPPGEMVRARVEACSGSIFKLYPRSHALLGQEAPLTILKPIQYLR